MTAKDEELPEEETEEALNESKKKKAQENNKKQGNKQILDFNIEKNEKGINDPEVERDVGFLFLKYIKEDLWLDFPANIPFLLFIMINGLPTTPEAIEE